MLKGMARSEQQLAGRGGAGRSGARLAGTEGAALPKGPLRWYVFITAAAAAISLFFQRAENVLTHF